MNDTELKTIQLRLEAIRHAITRSRFTLVISLIASIAVFVTTWNSYYSPDKGFVMQDYWSQDGAFPPGAQQARKEGIAKESITPPDDLTEVTDYAQQRLVSEWVTNQVISIGLLGIRISVSDLSIIGSAGLFIITVWLFLSIRRENRAIGTLLKHAYRIKDWDVQYMVYQGIVHYLVLIDFGRGDKPIDSFEEEQSKEIYHLPFLRSVVKCLFFLAPLSILFIIWTDYASLFRAAAPFRPSHSHLSNIIEWSEIKWLMWRDVFAFFLFLATAWISFKTIKFVTATGEVVNKFRVMLLETWPQSKENQPPGAP